MTTEVQILRNNGKPTWAILPYEQYEEMERRLAISKAQEEVSYPIDVAEMHAMKGYSLIKAWRIYLHKTQKELAAALNITQGAFSQIEKSDHNQAETIRRIAKVLNIQPEQLVF